MQNYTKNDQKHTKKQKKCVEHVERVLFALAVDGVRVGRLLIRGNILGRFESWLLKFSRKSCKDIKKCCALV